MATLTVGSGEVKKRGLRLVATMLAFLVLTTGAAVSMDVATAEEAQAWTGGCSWPRCTIYMNRAETHAFGWGVWIPRTPSSILQAVLMASLATLRYFARYYYQRGWCGAFQLSAVPWEKQSLFAYAGGYCR